GPLAGGGIVGPTARGDCEHQCHRHGGGPARAVGQAGAAGRVGEGRSAGGRAEGGGGAGVARQRHGEAGRVCARHGERPVVAGRRHAGHRDRLTGQEGVVGGEGRGAGGPGRPGDRRGRAIVGGRDRERAIVPTDRHVADRHLLPDGEVVADSGGDGGG